MKPNRINRYPHRPARSHAGAAALSAVGLVVVAGLLACAEPKPGAAPGPPPAGAAGGPPASESGARVLYHCPMHPTMIADRPGDCPICGMRLVRMASQPEGGTAAGAPGDGGLGTAGAGAAGPAVAGQASVQVPLLKQQLIGVRTGPVERVPFVRVLRTVGRVAVDERRIHHVHTKIEGWVEMLEVNATGEKVRRGQPLLSIYSPELLATQEEYLLALREQRRSQGTPLPDLARRNDELLESARRRLILYDLTEEQIARLAETGQASRTVTLYAPISGYVMARNVAHGQKIDSNTNLLDIADLSEVWVIASIYEYELPFVRAGQEAAMSLSYLPGKRYRGRVGLIYPVLEGATRTVQVRLEFPNPDMALRPEMYADIELRGDLGTRLAVPETAVLSTGTRDLVFVDRGGGHFEPRVVRTGLRLPDWVEILEGVRQGESVVISANFLIDSESKLKSALEAATGQPAPPHPH